MTRIVAAALLLLLACAPQAPSPAPAAAPEGDLAVVEAGVRQAFEEYVAHANAGEWDEALAFYSDDPRFHWVEDGAVAYPTKADLAVAIEAVYGTVEEMRLTVDDVRVVPLTDDLAWITASWEQNLTLTSGQTFSYGGATTILCERGADGWRFLSGHNSSFKPRGG